MGRRRRRDKPVQLTPEAELGESVARLLGADTISPAAIYQLLYLGFRVHRQNHPDFVWPIIVEAFRTKGRFYLTPGQMAALHDRPEPQYPEDFLHLDE